jgi:Zn-dependent peptidase ImmA (M78 family)
VRSSELTTVSGFLAHLVDGPLVAANSQQSAGRQRFTLAHELGHVALSHHADFHVDLAHPVSAGEPPGYDWRQERAANTFAANLLMPAGWIRNDRVAEKLSVGKLAARYGVSGEAMGIRLETFRLR